MHNPFVCGGRKWGGEGGLWKVISVLFFRKEFYNCGQLLLCQEGSSGQLHAAPMSYDIYYALIRIHCTCTCICGKGFIECTYLHTASIDDITEMPKPTPATCIKYYISNTA